MLRDAIDVTKATCQRKNTIVKTCVYLPFNRGLSLRVLDRRNDDGAAGADGTDWSTMEHSLDLPSLEEATCHARAQPEPQLVR